MNELNNDKTLGSKCYGSVTIRRRQCKEKRYNTIELKVSDLLRICRNEILREQVEEEIIKYKSNYESIK